MDSPSLRPYQQEDVDFLIQHEQAGCFNEQRTGKTPTALSCVVARGLQDKKILIVTTSSALYQWKDEYETWVQRPCEVVDGTPAKKKQAIDHWTHGLIISLGTLKTTSNRTGFVELILKKKPEMVILDEAHHIRNWKTCAAKSAFKLTRIPLRLALTGTPAYGTATDIYSILHFLAPNNFPSAYTFLDYYFIREQKPNKGGGFHNEWNRFQPGKAKELQQVLDKFCTQRKRKDVMQWLPEKDRTVVKLPLTSDQTKYLEDLKNKFQTEDLVVQGILDRLIRYRQICLDPELVELKGTSPKTQWVLDHIEENPDEPLIIFSNFTQYLRKLFNTLKEHNIKAAMIIGDVPATTRRKYQEDFQAGKFNVFLINTMSGKEALTLDRAESIIFTDVFPPVGAIDQAEDRFIATSEDKKDKPHAIYNLVMANSFDEDILKLIKKRETETAIINNFKARLERSSK